MRAAAGSRIKLGVKKRKLSSGVDATANHTLVTKVTSQKRRTQKNEQSYTEMNINALSLTGDIEMGCITPCKRMVVSREIPPSPFDLNLVPSTRSLSLIEGKFNYFMEHDGEDLDRYVSYCVHLLPCSP